MSYKNIELVIFSETRERFEAEKNSATMLGIITRTREFWANGEYYPLVYLDDYLKKGEAIDFANDLTGVQEATAEEFTFRPSAGFRSIRDESAVIRRIKGNTSVWAQLADNNASFTNSGNRYIITRNDDGSVTIKRDPSITSGYWCAYNMNAAYRHTSHKYMFYADVSVSGVQSSADYCGVSVYNLASATGNHPNFRTNGRHTFCCFGSPNSSTTWQFAFYVYGMAELTIHSLQCFDLTALYESGNEPTTLEEFRELYPDSYYPYCVPELRSMRATGIETIGFNAFNGEYAEVLGGMRYCISGDITRLGLSETIGGGIATIPIPDDGIYTPSKRGYLYAIGSDICVQLVHSGVCNGEHHDYERNVRLLPDIATYFPDGMHGIGGVFDEINEERAIKRLGVVDLGTLTWSAQTTNTSGVYRWQASGISAYPTATTSSTPNIRCAKYITGSNDDTYAKKDSITISTAGSIRIFDSNYQNTADKDAFVASLQGVILVYELAEPIVTPITEPLQLDYKVADFGTEKMLSDLPSSPFRADIVYQFNAEGRIRDNSRNIERLEDKVKNMATIEDIPTEIATATQRKVMWSEEAVLSLLPNILYDYSVGSLGSLALPPLSTGNLAYDDVWMVRVALASSESLTIPFEVLWRDSIAPSFNEWSIIDLTFRKNANGEKIIGEWKIYR